MIQNAPPLDIVLGQLGEIAAYSLDAATSLPPSIYWREDVAELERERIFRRDWVCAGLAADLSEPGDYLAFSIADEPVFCVRNQAGNIRTFANICRHRMMRLVEGSGRSKRIV
ncbi:MAG: aromatic ring-hydroxylating oxygenase subunit alpha, partial [Geminicoccaceae bacterium]